MAQSREPVLLRFASEPQIDDDVARHPLEATKKKSAEDRGEDAHAAVHWG